MAAMQGSVDNGEAHEEDSVRPWPDLPAAALCQVVRNMSLTDVSNSIRLVCRDWAAALATAGSLFQPPGGARVLDPRAAEAGVLATLSVRLCSSEQQNAAAGRWLQLFGSWLGALKITEDAGPGSHPRTAQAGSEPFSLVWSLLDPLLSALKARQHHSFASFLQQVGPLMKHLRQLTLSPCTSHYPSAATATTGDLPRALVLCPWPQLQLLELRGCRLGLAAGQLGEGAWPHLRYLGLSANELAGSEDTATDQPEAVAALARGCWPQLQKLDLSDNYIGARAAFPLVQGSWPELVELNLADNLMSVAFVQKIFRGPWPKLRTLSLGLEGDPELLLDPDHNWPGWA